MAEGFDEMEMEERSYPEYGDMDRQERENQYKELLEQRARNIDDDEPDLELREDIKSRLAYLNASLGETSFIQHNEKTVQAYDKGGGESLDLPAIPFVPPGEETLPTLSEFVFKTYGGARIDPRCDAAIELRNNISVTKWDNIEFRRRGNRGGRFAPQIVLRRDSDGSIKFSPSKVSKNAVNEFRPLLERAIAQTKERSVTREQMPMIELRKKYGNISGLSDTENRELEGVLNPPPSIDPASRIGDRGALQIQTNHFQELINDVNVEIDRADREDNLEEFIELEERKVGLIEARNRTIEQRELEQTADAQEGDLTRFERLKRWLKENALSVSVIGISIAGIVTSIIIAARKAIVKGAQATSKFAKAVTAFGKKLLPILGPLLNIIAQALTWAAKGIAWLAKNLWTLVVFGLWLAYEFYGKKRKSAKS